MAWSTRELADLAGTTLRTVRHYHDVGILPLPERTENGYKRYGIPHLLTLIRIRRLVDLGLPLAEVAPLLGPSDGSRAALRELDGHLESEARRIRAAREQLATMLEDLEHGADPAPELGPFRPFGLTPPDRQFMVLLVRIASPRVLDAYLGMLEATRDSEVLADYNALESDASEQARDDLAARMHQHLVEVYEMFPALIDMTSDSPVGAGLARGVIAAAFEQLYSPAQVDVMRRCSAQGWPRA